MSNDIIMMEPVKFWVFVVILGGIASVCFYVAFGYIRRARLI